MKIIAISGSLRKQSLNTRLGRLLEEVAGTAVDFELATLHGIPLYNGDEEDEHGIPEAVSLLRRRIKASDGLILITPEYNAGMPGVFKNALDWLTRPGEEMKPTFSKRPTALAGATPGAWGTALAQSSALINLRQLGVNLYPDYLRVSQAHKRLEEGAVDPDLKDLTDRWLKGFVDFIEA
jgi:NAD(P)H-dependent FMN reductase